MKNKSNISKNLNDKLKLYSKIAGTTLLLAPTVAKAAVQYTDPVDMIVQNNTISLDLNNDGQNDFKFYNLYSGSISIYNAIYAASGDASNNEVEKTNDYVKKILYGNSINNISESAWNWWNFHGSSEDFDTNNWIGASEKFIGVKFKVSGNFHYGWIRVSISGNGDAITIHDYAYEDSPNTGITAGDQGSTAEAPTISTAAVSLITGSSAVLGGNITNDGGASVTERGIVYSSSDTTPTIGEGSVIKDTNGSGTGSFSETISGLTSATTYYFRAYAINSEGTSYGSIDNFTTKTPGLWVGGISSDWNNASNWDDGNVPTSTVDVTIPSGCSNYPSIDESAVCQSITIENEGEISISSSFSLNVNGDFTLNDGSSFSNSGTLKFSGTCDLTDNRSTKFSLGNILIDE